MVEVYLAAYVYVLYMYCRIIVTTHYDMNGWYIAAEWCYR